MSAYKFNHKERSTYLACGGTLQTNAEKKEALYQCLTKYLNHETHSECAEFLVKEIEGGNVEALTFITQLVTEASISGVLAGAIECPDIFKEEVEEMLKDRDDKGMKKQEAYKVFVSPDLMGKMNTIH